jgi:hypothetical protein
MFDRYPQGPDYIPCNRPKPIKHSDLVIMTGETTMHSFEFPFGIDQYVSDIEVIYKLGINVVLIKHLNDIAIDIDKYDYSLITVTLSPEETKLFKDTVLTTKVQLKLRLVDESIMYTRAYKVKVFDSLDIDIKEDK